jgi:tRNA pseudouridine55 synthase
VSILVVDKPSGPSSFAVCKRVGAMLGRKREKIGHGGTLDPFASGVLPICIGEGTKVVPFLLDADKAYEAVVRFGVETDTLDSTGQVVAEHALGALASATVEAALTRFRGEIEQIPPMYSALKHRGRPLYVYARKGETVERPPRRVTVRALDMLAFDPPDRARLRIRCSKGTYIRQLAADLGKVLGVGAHLVELRRTASGPFAIEQSITLDGLAALTARGEPPPMVSPLVALAHLPRVIVDEQEARVLGHGQRMAWASFSRGRQLDGPVCAVVEREEGLALVAIVAQDDDVGVRILRGFSSRADASPQSVRSTS